MRVLMLGWEYPPHISGGLGTACQGIVGGLVGAGAEVLFVAPRLTGLEDGRGAWLLSAGDVALPPVPSSAAARGAAGLRERLQLAFVESPLRPYQTLASEVERYARAVAEIARREDFDVIHAHDWMTFPAGLLARRVSGRPLVCHVHASEYDRSGADADRGICAIEQTAVDAADGVVC